MQTGPSMGPTLQNRESSGGLKTTPKRGNLGKDRDCGHALPKGIYITSVLRSKILDHMATGPHIFHTNASTRPQHGSRWPQNGSLFLEPFSGIQTPKCPEWMARNIKYIIEIWTFSKKTLLGQALERHWWQKCYTISACKPQSMDQFPNQVRCPSLANSTLSYNHSFLHCFW